MICYNKGYPFGLISSGISSGITLSLLACYIVFPIFLNL